MNHATRRSAAIQLVKYVLVGCMNTLLTLGVIFVCKSLLGVNEYVSNAIGYFAGLVNSFFWNRGWVFHRANGVMGRQIVHFLLGFAVSYAVQFLVLWLLNQSWFGAIEVNIFGFWVISGYGFATLLANVAYTVTNFAYNRLVTFK